MKQYIYATYCLNQQLLLDNCIKRIYEVVKIEEFIALKNHKCDKHYEKWSKIILTQSIT